MLVLHRKSGEGIEIMHSVTKKSHDVDFLYKEGDQIHYRIDGNETSKNIKARFWLDKDEEVMAIIISSECGIKMGISAPRHWQIRRKEVPFKSL